MIYEMTFWRYPDQTGHIRRQLKIQSSLNNPAIDQKRRRSRRCWTSSLVRVSALDRWASIRSKYFHC